MSSAQLRSVIGYPLCESISIYPACPLLLVVFSHASRDLVVCKGQASRRIACACAAAYLPAWLPGVDYAQAAGHTSALREWPDEVVALGLLVGGWLVAGWVAGWVAG